MLERAALGGPLLISLDDLQWADSGTAAALRALPVRLAGMPIAWILAFRPGQGSAQLLSAIEHLDHSGAETDRPRPARRRRRSPRSPRTSWTPSPTTRFSTSSKGARGSPFVLTELLSGLRDEDLVRVVAGQAELVESRLPRRVGVTMRERLRGVSAPAREAATVAASLGRQFSFADLANMLDRPPAALLGPVDELIDCGMVVESGERLAFRHDVTRDAVRESVPVSARRALDRQAANVLLAAGATPVEVAAQIAAERRAGRRAGDLDPLARRRGARDHRPRGRAPISAGARSSLRHATTHCAGRSLPRPPCCSIPRAASMRRARSRTRIYATRFRRSRRPRCS